MPLIIALFSIQILLAIILDLFLKLKNNSLSKLNTIGNVCFMLICLFIITIHIGYLSHGGIHLIYERELNAVEVHGQIEEIEVLNNFTFPKIKTEYGYFDTPNGVKITINGIHCTAIVSGTLDIGDYVSVVYLPNSGYVLSILEANESPIDE